MRLRVAAITIFAFTVGGVALADTGPGTPRQIQSDAAKATFRSPSYRIQFDYPTWLRARQFNDNSSFSSLIVYLSNAPMHNPCVTRRSARSTTITCTAPMKRLPASSLLISWSANGFPEWSFSKAHGAATRIGGRPAKILISRSTCQIGANILVDAVIPIPSASDSWEEMRACIRGPHVGALEQTVRQILKSVSFPNL